MKTPHILLPTTDLYFLNAFRDRVGKLPLSKLPARQISPNVFVGRNSILVSRYISTGRLERLTRDGTRKLIYLIDDDIEAAPGDETLPPEYRRKMATFVDGPYQRILEKADTFVVSTNRLVEKYKQIGKTVRLTPCWHLGPSDSGHYAPLAEEGSTVKVAFLGTRIHQAEMAFLVPIVEEILDRHQNVDMTLFWGRHAPGGLASHPRVHVRRGMIWPLYKRLISRWRYHLALYPTIESPFNSARSINKMIEHGIVGAIGVYSAGSLIAEHVEMGASGIVVDNRQKDWVEAISEAIAHPDRLQAVFEAGRDYATQLNDRQTQRAFWQTQFN